MIEKTDALEKEYCRYIDKVAFSELYNQYKTDFYRFAFFYLKNREEAEDAVSETVIMAYRGIKGLKNVDNFKSWIFKILFRNCKHRYKNLIKSRNTLDIDETPDTKTEDFSLAFAESIDLKEKIDSLSKKEREIIWLSLTAGYKSHEISEITGLSAANVRTTLCRTLLKLRTALEQKNGGN